MTAISTMWAFLLLLLPLVSSLGNIDIPQAAGNCKLAEKVSIYYLPQANKHRLNFESTGNDTKTLLIETNDLVLKVNRSAKVKFRLDSAWSSEGAPTRLTFVSLPEGVVSDPPDVTLTSGEVEFNVTIETLSAGKAVFFANSTSGDVE